MSIFSIPGEPARSNLLQTAAGARVINRASPVGEGQALLVHRHHERVPLCTQFRVAPKIIQLHGRIVSVLEELERDGPHAVLVDGFDVPPHPGEKLALTLRVLHQEAPQPLARPIKVTPRFVPPISLLLLPGAVSRLGFEAACVLPESG